MFALGLACLAVFFIATGGPSSGVVNLCVGVFLASTSAYALTTQKLPSQFVKAGFCLLFMGGIFWILDGAIVLEIIRGDAFFLETTANILSLIGFVLLLV